jgi:hypothetical protein
LITGTVAVDENDNLVGETMPTTNTIYPAKIETFLVRAELPESVVRTRHSPIYPAGRNTEKLMMNFQHHQTLCHMVESTVVGFPGK